MADNESAVLAKLEELASTVNAKTTGWGNELAAAAATARAAQKSEDQAEAKAEHDAALAKIEEISKSLVAFSPSGN